MPQYPANIDLSSLNGTTGVKLSGDPGPGERAGRSVASAGDVNGDGFADVIVGAWLGDPHGTYSGASYVVFGKAAGFAANIDLTTLDGTAGFKLSGAMAYDYSGASVASAGDVNGDGFDDVIVGAYGADPNGSKSGASYVVFGKASGFAANLDLSTLDGATGFKLTGAAANDHSGFSVASAGDVNGDGFADLIVGAYGANSSVGTSYVVFGKASGFGANLDLSTLNGTTGFKLTGVSYSGFSVASAGDVNGDGFADLIIGAIFDGGSGASYVVFGKASGFAANIDLSSLDGTTGFKLSGATSLSRTGQSVASAGDVNGDGFADLIVGAPKGGLEAGASYVVFGKASGFAANLALSTLDGTTGFKLSGAAGGDQSGYSVASAGDVNGDGFADLIVGARYADPHGTSSGASYVVFGKASGFAATIALSTLDGTTGFKLSGVAAGDRTGYAVASAGDVNGDGLADLIVGATRAGGGGAGYVMFGQLPDTAVNRVGTGISQTLVGGELNDTLSGLGGDDTLWGHGGNDTLIGGAGADALIGGAGNDTASYAGSGSGVTINLLMGSAAGGDAAGDTLSSVESLTGSAFVDVLTGDGGDNTLDGGSGIDTMTGGTGNDTYVVDNDFDQVVENAGEGTDTVNSSLPITVLTANVENLVLTGTANLVGFGNGLANALYGNSGNNTLDGQGDADAMFGGAGNDNYFVDSGFDQLVENVGEGNDSVYSSVLYVLGANVENLYLQGNSPLNGYGNAIANALYGNSADNVLDGMGGADGMIGGAGNDSYFVDNNFDVVAENASEGNDSVYANQTYVLGAHVENLYLQGSADLGGYGNTLANAIYGNDGNNNLDGFAGADGMIGGLGNDIYFVDNNFDQVVENPGEGTSDTVYASQTYVLGNNVEFLYLTGGANLSAFGNTVANVIQGNSGDNVLNGRQGADTLAGNAGNDTFQFTIGEAHGDIVFDFAGNGAAAGDSLQFVNYGAGATFTQIDGTQWQINYNGGTQHEVITFSSPVVIDPTDYAFVTI